MGRFTCQCPLSRSLTPPHIDTQDDMRSSSLHPSRRCPPEVTASKSPILPRTSLEPYCQTAPHAFSSGRTDTKHGPIELAHPQLFWGGRLVALRFPHFAKTLPERRLRPNPYSRMPSSCACRGQTLQPLSSGHTDSGETRGAGPALDAACILRATRQPQTLPR